MLEKCLQRLSNIVALEERLEQLRVVLKTQTQEIELEAIDEVEAYKYSQTLFSKLAQTQSLAKDVPVSKKSVASTHCWSFRSRSGIIGCLIL